MFNVEFELRTLLNLYHLSKKYTPIDILRNNFISKSKKGQFKTMTIIYYYD